MADNKRWFKVWASILTDPEFDALDNSVIGTWVRIGALVSKHGVKGVIKISRKQLEKRINSDIDVITNDLRKINVIIETDGNDDCTVIIKNWHKYQVDSTSYDRLKKHRKAQNDNGVRREEKKIKKKNKEIKIKELFLEYVFLTKEEYKKLLEQFGNAGLDSRIWNLNNYIGSTGAQNKYKSHYHTILAWEKKKEGKTNWTEG